MENIKTLEFKAIIRIPEDGVGAFVECPFDAEKEFGKKRVKVHATFDGEPYDGLVCRMGIYNDNGESIFLIIVPKAIRAKINKQGGDLINVKIIERTSERRYGC